MKESYCFVNITAESGELLERIKVKITRPFKDKKSAEINIARIITEMIEHRLETDEI